MFDRSQACQQPVCRRTARVVRWNSALGLHQVLALIWHESANSVDRPFLPSVPEMNFLGAWLHSESTASTQLGGFP